MELTIQLRADHDEKHTSFLQKLVNGENILPDGLIKTYQCFFWNDFNSNDHSWINATVLVTINREINDIIGNMVQRLAISQNTHAISQ